MSDSSNPSIDEQAYSRLEEIADGDVEFLIELLKQYLVDAENLMQQMRAGSDAADAKELEIAAHTLKSASANVGAMQLSAVCKELQEMGRSGEIEGREPKVAAAGEEFGRVREALEERLAKLG